jgi:alpha-tubulin suppressor-like RCC1 family protein
VKTPNLAALSHSTLRLLRVLAVAAFPLIFLCVNATEIVQWGDPSQKASGPTNPPVGLTNTVAIVGGFYHSLALTSEGHVIAWGNNDWGQTDVPPDLTNVVGFAAGAYHNLALTGDGRVTAWGYNNSGQANVPTGLSNVVQVSAGEDHSLALREDGQVVAWGRMGYGVTVYPMLVPSGLTNAVTIASGAQHALAITAEGLVIAWGLNSPATNVPGGLSNVVAITAGRDQSIALTATDDCWCGESPTPFKQRMYPSNSRTYFRFPWNGSGVLL